MAGRGAVQARSGAGLDSGGAAAGGDCDGSEATIECLPTGAGSSLALWTLRTTASVIAGHHDLYGPALWKFIVRMANGDARSLCFGEPAAGAAASR
ncbi:MAG: hypothetical protein NFV71_16570 [Candidatus Accumulibacter sp.]|uniref:hypothetical protein n=1 Tax=Accumulibacter sp. TaxID=2053492 RepID=UPI0025E26C7F|nr:hypothetical protein [Accumulibacter sp.]MCM8596937.1 hypothetical protein [Accumulibacter sp.]MCM8624431.1 hypothetical protein [Accumulibacter sp.]MDS4051086.1 hypothetical protein [Accumulibacter sp.]